MASGIGIQGLLILFLILLNAFFAASEIAIISVNENKLKKMASEGSKRAQKLIKLISEPSKFLATIQVGITFAGFLASAAAAESFAGGLSGLIKSIKLPVPDNIINAVSLLIVVIVLSYITLVIGELVPKRLAMDNAQKVSMWVVIPLEFIGYITAPFVKFLTISTNFFVKLFGGTAEATENKITEEEIRLMVDVGEEKGIIRDTEKEMIDNIFEFDDTHVSTVMTHRTDIVGLSIDASLHEVLEVISSEHFSRIPVYEDDIDNIVGILNIKDLLTLIDTKGEKSFKLKDFIRKPVLVPKSKKTDELFKELQKSKNHIAVVIDEYGGTAGIITIEDLLEEIVGNIFDEYDEEETEIEKIDENTFMVSGTISIETFNDYFNVHLSRDGYETLSGFIISQLGKIPLEDEKPVVECQELVIKVESVEEKRITKVKVCKV